MLAGSLFRLVQLFISHKVLENAEKHEIPAPQNSAFSFGPKDHIYIETEVENRQILTPIEV